MRPPGMKGVYATGNYRRPPRPLPLPGRTSARRRGDSRKRTLSSRTRHLSPEKREPSAWHPARGLHREPAAGDHICPPGAPPSCALAMSPCCLGVPDVGVPGVRTPGLPGPPGHTGPPPSCPGTGRRTTRPAVRIEVGAEGPEGSPRAGGRGGGRWGRGLRGGTAVLGGLHGRQRPLSRSSSHSGRPPPGPGCPQSFGGAGGARPQHPQAGHYVPCLSQCGWWPRTRRLPRPVLHLGLKIQLRQRGAGLIHTQAARGGG